MCRESLDPSPQQEDCVHCHLFLYVVVHFFVKYPSTSALHVAILFAMSQMTSFTTTKVLPPISQNVFLDSSATASNYVQSTYFEYSNTQSALPANFTLKLPTFSRKTWSFWWRHHHFVPWSHLLRDHESSEWWHHAMACYQEQMRIFTLKCIRASERKRRGRQFYMWTGGSWLKINTEASLEWKLKVSSEPDAKNWVTG